eukprot:15470164-Alexandrium_andersonii.AAC.1
MPTPRRPPVLEHEGQHPATGARPANGPIVPLVLLHEATEVAELPRSLPGGIEPNRERAGVLRLLWHRGGSWLTTERFCQQPDPG